ncbi:unnamed protein product [Ambrosiozyma monospora]|uniref:Unnamed protein product n=1 Tax=Ambrosiozyma monospora TaxID=43982 RepID=A0A9W7DE81_AMBMO|nr:unnamed protein product [Ambrosiozyma monospora]
MSLSRKKAKRNVSASATRSYSTSKRYPAKEITNISVESIESITDDSIIVLDSDDGNDTIDDIISPTSTKLTRTSSPKKPKKQYQSQDNVPIPATRSKSWVQDVTRRFSQSQPSSAKSSPKKKKRKITQQLDLKGSFTSSFKSMTPPNSVASRPSSDVIKSDSSTTWVEKYMPQRPSDISIRKQKLTELRTKLEDLIYHKTDIRMLVLSGPSGSGKSTSAKLLCEEIMSEKIESMKHLYSQFSTQMPSYESFEINSSISDDQLKNNKLKHVVEFHNLATSTSSLTSSVTYFSSFLEQCKLLTSHNEKCIVVEDLPNLYHHGTLHSFQNSLIQWVTTSPEMVLPPLVLCITEVDTTDDNSRGHTLFTIDNVFKVETVLGFPMLDIESTSRNNGVWQRVKFLPVAKTYLKQALDRVVKGEPQWFGRIPVGVRNKEVMALSKCGDLRNAINMLEYWAKYFYSGDCHDDDVDRALTKESALDFFHYLGKVIHGTQHPEEEWENFMKRANMSLFHTKDDMNRFKNSVNSISVENVSADIVSVGQKFNLTLLESYLCIDPPNCEDRALLIDVLSCGDLLNSFEGQNQLSMQLAAYHSCLGVRLKCANLKLIGSLVNAREKGATNRKG